MAKNQISNSFFDLGSFSNNVCLNMPRNLYQYRQINNSFLNLLSCSKFMHIINLPRFKGKEPHTLAAWQIANCYLGVPHGLFFFSLLWADIRIWTQMVSYNAQNYWSDLVSIRNRGTPIRSCILHLQMIKKSGKSYSNV